MRPGLGYGYNCAVIFDPPEANLPDGKGTFFWDGAAGTWFWVDPTNDLVFVGTIQRMTSPDNHSLVYRSRTGPGASSTRRNRSRQPPRAPQCQRHLSLNLSSLESAQLWVPQVSRLKQIAKCRGTTSVVPQSTQN